MDLSSEFDLAFEDEAKDGPESWYNEDDTEEEIPDPNNDPNPLFQDQNKIPEALRKSHFLEGLLYSLTLKKEKDVTYLGLLILRKDQTFIFRVYHALGTSRKTFHTGATDKE